MQIPGSINDGQWQVKAPAKVRSSFTYVMLAVLLAGGASALAINDINMEHMRWMGMGVMGIFVLWALYASSAAMGKTATLTLSGDRLILAVKRTSRLFHLRDSQMLLGKHYGAKNYRYFTGTMCHLSNPSGTEVWRILGAGAEFPADQCKGPETYGGKYDCYVDATGFRELLTAIEKASGTTPLFTPSGVAADQKAEDFSTDRVFEAFPMKGGALAPMMIWMGSILLVTVLGFFASSLVPQELLDEYGPFAAVGLLVPALFLVIFVSVKKGKRKGQLKLSRYGLEVRVNNRPIVTLQLPLQEARRFDLEVNAQHMHYYTGPAIGLKDRRGNKVRLLISDATLAWPDPDKKVSSSNYSIGTDAGRALLTWLHLAGHPAQEYHFADAQELGHKLPYWLKKKG